MKPTMPKRSERSQQLRRGQNHRSSAHVSVSKTDRMSNRKHPVATMDKCPQGGGATTNRSDSLTGVSSPTALVHGGVHRNRPPTPPHIRQMISEVDSVDVEALREILVPKDASSEEEDQLLKSVLPSMQSGTAFLRSRRVTSSSGRALPTPSAHPDAMDQLDSCLGPAMYRLSDAPFLEALECYKKKLQRQRPQRSVDLRKQLTMKALLCECVETASLRVSDGCESTHLEDFLRRTTLRLSHCDFYGAIGDALEAFTSVHHLYLDHNHFTHMTPTSLTFMLSLTTLDLSHNQLTAVAGIHDLTSLETLCLDHNALQLPICELLAQIPYESIQTFRVCNNPGNYEREAIKFHEMMPHLVSFDWSQSPVAELGEGHVDGKSTTRTNELLPKQETLDTEESLPSQYQDSDEDEDESMSPYRTASLYARFVSAEEQIDAEIQTDSCNNKMQLHLSGENYVRPSESIATVWHAATVGERAQRLKWYTELLDSNSEVLPDVAQSGGEPDTPVESVVSSRSVASAMNHQNVKEQPNKVGIQQGVVVSEDDNDDDDDEGSQTTQPILASGSRDRLRGAYQHRMKVAQFILSDHWDMCIEKLTKERDTDLAHAPSEHLIDS